MEGAESPSGHLSAEVAGSDIVETGVPRQDFSGEPPKDHFFFIFGMFINSCAKGL